MHICAYLCISKLLGPGVGGSCFGEDGSDLVGACERDLWCDRMASLIPGMSLRITTKNLHGKNGNMQRKLHQKAIC